MDKLAENGKVWSAEFARLARPFSVRWRRARLRRRAGLTLPLVLALAVGFLALVRLTLADIPDDLSLLLFVPPAWGLLLGLAYLFDRPPLLPLARSIDRALNLDERLGSAMALAHRPGSGGPEARLLRRLRLDALHLLEERGGDAGQLFRPRLPVPRIFWALSILLIISGAVLLAVPSPVAAKRAERAALRATVAAQAAKLAAARREVIARPDVAGAARDAAANNLAAAEDALTKHPDDRAAGVAALAQAEDNLRAALPPDYAQATAARKAAARDLRNSVASLVDVEIQGNNDLDEAAAALEYAGGELVQAGPNGGAQRAAVAGNLDRIASSLDATDPALAAQMRAAATELRKPNGDITSAMKTLGDGLRAVGQEQAGTDLMTHTLAQLGDSKSQVAQAGLPKVADAAPGQANRPLGKVRGGAAGAGGSGGGDGSGPSTDGSGQAGTGSTQNANSSGGTTLGAGTGPGTNQNANVQGGGGGANGGGANPQGIGTGGTGPAKAGPVQVGAGEDDTVYVPGANGTLAIKEGGTQEKVPGVESPGKSGDDTGLTVRAAGTNPGVKTPYSKVIGQYRDAAAQALDHSYIPTDAKGYVRDYFDSLVDKGSK